MNGADRLCDTLLANGVDVCFANPGTSEMHFVAALDRKPELRCILGLSEGVVAGAADGYARMKDKPAATLFHLGPGLGNALANLHNARRARTPMINIVGDHASYHLHLDAPLTSDIESIARPMSHWVKRIKGAEDIERQAAAAYRAAMTLPGIATLILPADASWSSVEPKKVRATRLAPLPMPDEASLSRAASTLRKGGERIALMLTGAALRGEALKNAGRIAQATGCRLIAQGSNGRVERGQGRVPVERVPYVIDIALPFLKDLEAAILFGAKAPVAFFAYPGKPGELLPAGCDVQDLAPFGTDMAGALAWLADALSAQQEFPAKPAMEIPLPQDGALTADAICAIVARMLPEEAIIIDEAITSGRRFFEMTQDGPRHDFLALTGGAIGIGIPLAAGAALAAPGRKVVALQADGSGMYTIQGLWTQAREKLDVVTVVFANHKYNILQGEMRAVGVNDFGANASRMLNLDGPNLDWVTMARGMGVEAERATTTDGFRRLLESALTRHGPFLIEAAI